MIPEVFYLASTEGCNLERPRRCLPIKRLRGEDRDDYLLVSLDPPLYVEASDVGGMELDQVIIATRHRGESLFLVTGWPVYVHVARLLVPFRGQDAVQNGEMESLAWAELYQTETAAREKML